MCPPSIFGNCSHSIDLLGNNIFAFSSGGVFLESQTGVKIAIIGAGQVGASVAFAIMSSGLASDLVLVDVDKDKAKGEALNLGDAAVFTKPAGVIAGDFEDCRDAHIIIFTAGSNQKPAIAFVLKRICEAVIRDENSILTVSGLVDHLYDIEGCCLSMSCIINGRGRSEVIPLPCPWKRRRG